MPNSDMLQVVRVEDLRTVLAVEVEGDIAWMESPHLGRTGVQVIELTEERSNAMFPDPNTIALTGWRHRFVSEWEATDD